MAAWVARNNGLTGNDLVVNWMVQNPATRHLNSTSHEIWIATGPILGGGIRPNGNILRSIDGGRLWETITMTANPTIVAVSNNAFTGTPTQREDIVFYWIDFNPINEQTLFALAFDEGRDRIFIYKTTDIGLNWEILAITV